MFYGWYLVAASFVTNLVMTATFWQGFQVFFLPILREFGWSRAAISGAFTLRQLETGILAPVLGFAVDRYGPRRVIVVSGFVVGLGILAVSRTWSLGTFYGFFLLASMGASGTSHTITWPVAIARWFRRRRGMVLGIATSGPFLAGILLPFMTLLVQEVGWRQTLVYAGLTIWLVVLPLGSLVRDSPEPYGQAPDGDAPEPGAGTVRSSASPFPAAESRGHTLKEALHGRDFWLISTLFGILFFGLSGFQVHQIPYFESLGWTPTRAALTVTGVLFLSGAGRMGAGALADVLSLRFVLVALVLMHLTAWVYLATVDVSSIARMLPFTVLYGVAFGSMVSLRPVLLVKFFGTRSLGSLSGLIQSGTLISGMVGPVMMGLVFDVTGEYSAAIHIIIGVTLTALPLAFLIKPPGPAPSRGPV